jgi:hypothetical protein
MSEERTLVIYMEKRKLPIPDEGRELEVYLP